MFQSAGWRSSDRLASTGPRSGERGDKPSKPTHDFTTFSFNGAALGRARRYKTVNSSAIEGVELQRGRARESAEMA